MSKEDYFWILRAEPEDWSSIFFFDCSGITMDSFRNRRCEIDDLVACNKILGRALAFDQNPKVFEDFLEH